MIKKIIFFCFSALFFLVAAIYNGYPLVYSDTSTYLASGFELETPADRPITYGLFLRISSFNGLSLWLTIFLQSLLLVYLIYRLLVLLKTENVYVKTLVVILICVFTTGISWTSSQLIADVFTPMLLLIWALLFLDKDASKKRILFYGIFLFFVSSMHMSHFIMSVIFSVILLLGRLNQRMKTRISLLKIAVIILASGMSFVVFASSYSKYKHVFFVAKMNESKLLKKILDEQCGNYKLKLCAFKDSLPETANDFIWDKKSPLNKLGGYKEVKPEFNKIISIALSNRNYLTDIFANSCKESSKQIVSYGIGDGNGVFMEGTQLYERITKYVPGEITSYSESRQQKGILVSMSAINMYFSIMMIISFSGILLVFIYRKINFNLKVIGLILLVGILINAVVCGSLAPVADRFGCRVVWFVVFYMSILFIDVKPFSKNNLSHEKK